MQMWIQTLPWETAVVHQCSGRWTGNFSIWYLRGRFKNIQGVLHFKTLISCKVLVLKFRIPILKCSRRWTRPYFFPWIIDKFFKSIFKVVLLQGVWENHKVLHRCGFQPWSSRGKMLVLIFFCEILRKMPEPESFLEYVTGYGVLLLLLKMLFWNQ